MLTGLSYGAHNLTVYATDASGNKGTSETITFTIVEHTPFPAVAVVVGVSFVSYFVKKERAESQKTASSLSA